MAKSVRASVTKRNRAKLRATVFGPAVDARTERLSAKLQELASQPRPNEEKSSMELDDATTTSSRPISIWLLFISKRMLKTSAEDLKGTSSAMHERDTKLTTAPLDDGSYN
ncbi:sulfatase [Aspergillus luchuensis]|uniref:Sulfatase n=1 Tax=Aspergillus kawachii TaxID=1069201 RepID=A0A146G1P0_ASPKA|nr:sulfatase [Aspergillus luchuensis]